MPPILSIVIPAYNVSLFIAAAVRSALAQTLSDIEVIVVDDGSLDNTAAIVRSFTDPRLRLIRRSNGGLSAARNTGIAEARADLIGFLDGDDTWHPEKARQHVDLMEADVRIGLTFSHSAYMDQAGIYNGRILLCDCDRPQLRDMLVRNWVGNGSSPVVRAGCFRAAGLFDENLRSCEDWEMWVRLLRDTRYKAVLVPEPLTNYRMNPASLSMDHARFLAEAEKAAAKMRAETPALMGSAIRQGLASCYRIAGTKGWQAGGSRRKSLELLLKSVRICPWLPLVDLRLLATLAMMAVPRNGAQQIHAQVARWTGRHLRHNGI